MNRRQFSLARMISSVVLTALVCGTMRFAWDYWWLLFPSLGVVVVAAYATLIVWGRGRMWLAGFTFGSAAGWLLTKFAIDFAGIGHGTLLPFLVFFSPIASVQIVLDLLRSISEFYWLNMFLFAGAPPLLYGLYGAAVGEAARKGWGPRCFIAILLAHYGCLGLEFCLGFGGDVSALRQMFHMMPVRMIAAAIFFVGIHCATAVYVIAARRGIRDLALLRKPASCDKSPS